MKVRGINSGSSSIKYQLFDMTGALALASGLIERIGEPHLSKHHMIDAVRTSPASCRFIPFVRA
jgi:acetate kinase